MRNKIIAFLSFNFILQLAPTLLVGQHVDGIENNTAKVVFSNAEQQMIKKYYEINIPMRRGKNDNNDDKKASTGKKNKHEKTNK